MYLDIALPVPLRRTFHYLPPTSARPEALEVGCRVKVPFGRQQLVGVIVGHLNETDFDSNKIKTITETLDHTPIIEGKLLDLCVWAADYYHHSLGEVLHSAIPVLLRQGAAALEQTQQLKPLSTDLDALNRAPRQRALLQALMNSKDSLGLSRDQLKKLEFDSNLIKALIERKAAQWIEVEHSQPVRSTPNIGDKLRLSAEQASALEGVQSAGTHLLFGITGSGKTEVYLQAIEAVIKAGKQALVLVPEIGLTPQTISRFEQRFAGSVVAMHSGLNNTQRLNAWRQAKSGEISVVVGTRSAIFTPMMSPGLIVVDEEHDASFKQQDGFRYSARDLAVKRGNSEGVPVILGSATPSLESYANSESGRYTRFDLTTRANEASFAKYKIIGIEHQTLSEGFSPSLTNLIAAHLDHNNQVLVFLNRRGFAPVLHCRQCRWLSNCRRCDARMTYHLSTRKLVCHHCDTQHLAPTQCPDCGSREIVPLGTGTQRLESGLQQLFPGEEIIRIDRDSTRGKNVLEEKIERATNSQRGILLGTQLLAKGHHFPNVTLVAVVDLDAGLFSSDYHAMERMGQLLLQVGGRSGREKKQGTVASQTLYPEQPSLNILIEHGYEAFCKTLLTDRKQSHLPPYAYHAIIRAESANPQSANQFLETLTNQYPSQARQKNNVELLGPIPAPMEKRAGRFRAQLLISSSSRGHLHHCLKVLIPIAESSKLARTVRWSIDVDPYDLF